MKQLHRITGIIISSFIILHLFNHSMAWFSIETHQKVLDTFRSFYRIPIIEFIIISSFIFQTYSGIRLFFILRKKKDKTNYEKIQMYSGIALVYFLIQHIPATIGQRFMHRFDTNFYFAAKVVNEKPWLYYFVPYYFIGIIAIGLHTANVHRQKTNAFISSKMANIHFYAILLVFTIIAFIILYSFMGGRYVIEIPKVYNVN